ncbi:ETUD1 [Hepatospora eriocheir]|uniref:ETUD1 n=1 Tax=Hepatospora eriocheir TaxID=1081669 RepID=A0A1X0QAM5_9MICR|nr:ETUD1 [Hepatospora eriocheir]
MIKNITVIVAHIDHGKTTLVDSFLASKNYIPSTLAGEMRYLDSREDEQLRGITLKNSFLEIEGEYYIDTPGHVDFGALIHSASFLADNFILVIDIAEGIMPRTVSLIKFIDKNKTVLILNKADKAVEYSEIESLVYQINNLVGEEVFQWSKNNIVLCTAKNCGAVNFNYFKASKKNTLKNAYKAFQLLYKKIIDGDTEKLKEKYKIKVNTLKNYFSVIFPVSSTINNSISCLMNVDRDPFEFIIEKEFKGTIYGITTYCLLKKQTSLKRQNVVFVTRIFNKLKTGECVFCCTSNGYKKVEVEKIFNFTGEDLIETNEAMPNTLVCLKGDFLKDSLLTSLECHKKPLKNLFPLYLAKIRLKDLSNENLEKFKESLKTLGLLEHSLKVHKNRYNEFEIKCCGIVQFEKICEDLRNNDLEFSIISDCKKFKEFARNTAYKKFITDNYDFLINVEPSDELEVHVSSGYGVAYSALKVFVNEGPLIRESIIKTKITIEIKRGSSVSLFGILKQALTETFLESNPSICPLYYDTKIYITTQYLGNIYTLLPKLYYVIKEEVYDEENDFFIIYCKIPQFLFKEAVDQIYTQSKGTAYLEGIEDDFLITEYNFSEYITTILKDKGLYKEEKIVEDASKQRTMRM